MVSTINLFNCLKFKLPAVKSSILGSKTVHSYREYGLDAILSIAFSLYYFVFYSNYIGLIMAVFSYFVYKIGKIWRTHDSNWEKHNILLFVNAWILQFIGHFIEGNRPAFFTSIKMSVFEAPLYTLQSLFSFSVNDNL